MKLFVFQIFLFVFLISMFSRFSHKTYAINGCFCGESSSCYSDGCTRKTIQSDGVIDYGLCGSAGCGGAYNSCYNTDSVDANRYFCTQQPPCCAEMVRRNDPEACCWPERGYCHPFYCEQVDRKEQCGWYWSYHGEASERSQGYGCTKGTSNANLQPVFGLPPGVPGTQPTSSPQPTSVPTSPPTSIPTQYIPPTNSPSTVPTHSTIPPLVFPTSVPVVYPTSVPMSPSFSLPSFTFPTINTAQLKSGAKYAIVRSEKTLSIPSDAVNTITQLDASLELTIERFIQGLISAFSN